MELNHENNLENENIFNQGEIAIEDPIIIAGPSQDNNLPLHEEHIQAENLDMGRRQGPMADGDPDIPANQPKRRKNTEPTLNIGTLNMRGYRTQNKEPKIPMIKRMMEQNQIAVLAVQETHLREEDTEKLKQRNPKLDFILNGVSTQREGVGFIINKKFAPDLEILETGKITTGRAMWIRVKWKNTEEYTVVNTHLPNITTVGTDAILAMLTKINGTLKKDKNHTIWLGDFNMTLYQSDRIPASDCDNRETQEKLRSILTENKLMDGWKEQHPESPDWTFEQKRGDQKSRSRIDRIYCKENDNIKMNTWKIIRTLPELSDHHLAMVKIEVKTPVEQGQGYWRLPRDMIEYQPFVKKTRDILLECQTRMNGQPNMIQDIWVDTKEKIARACQIIQKERKEKLKKKEANLNLLLERYKREMKEPENIEQASEEVDDIEYLLDEYEREKAEKEQLAGKAKFRVEGETMSKFYFALNKDHNKKNLIEKLTRDGRTTHKLDEMAHIATQYHAELQKKPEMNNERKKAIRKMKKSITNKLEENDQQMLAHELTKDEIMEAMKHADNGKAPGRDGLTYEFYKYWMNTTKENEEEQEEEQVDIVEILTRVMRTIDETGTIHEKLNEGVMFLLYKKGDKDKIENYRPLTLLNTDYKIYTKTIATRLGSVANKLLHKDQAGFVPGRSIYDQIKLAKLMIPYAERNEENGMIVSLDQEKAYDKIDHDYLWKILATMKFPEQFITRIKALYTNAKTNVMMNGKLPYAFDVERGVRQGDPLSCILFDLAIEPLANRLRGNKKLKGLKIPGTNERLIVNMFADDTLVFLSETDNEKHLNKTIKDYCTASTARYNLNKTSYIPIGTKEFRNKIETEGKMNGRQNPMDKNLIVKEGQSVRILGAWLGNNTNADEKWNKILDESQRILERWNRTHPTLNGKVIVINALIASRSWYLAMVNEMPDFVNTKLKKMFHTFLWNGKRNGIVNWETATMRKDRGGLGLVDIDAKLETMKIMWAKQWLNPTEDRPRWAYIADALISSNASATPKTTHKARINWALQNWNIIRQGKNQKLEKELLEMVKTIDKYGIKPDGALLSEETKGSMPAVYHRFAKDTQLEHRKSARCLVENHNVRTMTDLLNEEQDAQCKKKPCKKMKEKLLENIKEKWSAALNTHNWDNLDHTPQRIGKYKKRLEDNSSENIVFNPDIMEKGHALNTIRIFTKQNENIEVPALRDQNMTNDRQITIYTDGSCKELGTVNARTGAGIWGGRQSPYNRSIRVPGKVQTNQRGELIAIMETLRIIPKDKPLKIKTDSRYAINGICKHAKTWEDKGWMDVANADIFKTILARLRARQAKTTFKWVKGHNNILGNEHADRLAGQGADKETFDEIDWTYREEFVLTGARLSALSFADVYRWIKETNTKENKKEKKYIEEAEREVKDLTGQVIEEEQIWKGMRKDPIPKNIGDFIWKLAHDRLPMGKTVMHYKEGDTWSKCKKCGVFESPEHMFWTCQEGYGIDLWNTAKELWSRMYPNIEWTEISIGVIVGLGAIQFKNDKGKTLQGATQMFKTIVSTTVWVIWTLRCKLVMAEEKTDKQGHLRRWTKLLIQQYKEDETIKKKYPGKKISEYKWKGNNYLVDKHPMTGKDYLKSENLMRLIEY